MKKLIFFFFYKFRLCGSGIQSVGAGSICSAVSLNGDWYHWSSSSPIHLINYDRSKVGNVVSTKCGHETVLGLTSSGKVLCAGAGKSGQLGLGVGIMSCPQGQSMVIDGLEGIVRIECGPGHCGALDADGRLFLWGWNPDRRVASAPEEVVWRPCMHSVSEAYVVEDFSLGGSHTVALCRLRSRAVIPDEPHVVRYWGRHLLESPNKDTWEMSNESYQAGRSPETLHLGEFANDPVAVACGRTFTAILDSAGRILLFGRFQLRPNQSPIHNISLIVSESGSPFVKIFAGGGMMVALAADGTLQSMGNSGYGASGQGYHPTPGGVMTLPAGIRPVVDVAVGGSVVLVACEPVGAGTAPRCTLARDLSGYRPDDPLEASLADCVLSVAGSDQKFKVHAVRLAISSPVLRERIAKITREPGNTHPQQQYQQQHPHATTPAAPASAPQTPRPGANEFRVHIAGLLSPLPPMLTTPRDRPPQQASPPQPPRPPPVAVTAETWLAGVQVTGALDPRTRTMQVEIVLPASTAPEVLGPLVQHLYRYGDDDQGGDEPGSPLSTMPARFGSHLRSIAEFLGCPVAGGPSKKASSAAALMAGHAGLALSDVELVAGSSHHRRQLHRFILIRRCPKFRALLASGLSESRGRVVQVAVEREMYPAFDYLLEYLYCGSAATSLADLDSDTVAVEDVLTVADEYLVDGLKRACVLHIAAHTNADNAAETHQLGVTRMSEDLRAVAIDRLIGHVARSQDGRFAGPARELLSKDTIEMIEKRGQEMAQRAHQIAADPNANKPQPQCPLF